MRSIFPSRREIEGQIRLSAGCDPSCDDRLHKLKKSSLKTACVDTQTNRQTQTSHTRCAQRFGCIRVSVKGRDLDI